MAPLLSTQNFERFPSRQPEEDVRMLHIREKLGFVIEGDPNLRKIIQQIIVYKGKLHLLVTGPPGSGKELVPRCVAAYGGVPIVLRSVVTLNPQVLASELFGSKKGGFTGAVERPGLFQKAGDGVVALDELGSMEQDVQAQLLRAIDPGEFSPVGSDETIPFPGLVVGMTSDPQNIIPSLMNRLGNFHINLPSLSDRPQEHCIALVDAFASKNDVEITREAAELAIQKALKGNVRGLRDLVKGAALHTSHDHGAVEGPATIHSEQIEAAAKHMFQNSAKDINVAGLLNGKLSDGTPAKELLDLFRQMLAHKAMELHKGNKLHAAKHLDITTVTLGIWLQNSETVKQ